MGCGRFFLFDGVKTTQITEGDYPSQDVGIEDGYIVYSQKTEFGWDVYMYDIENEKTILLTPNNYGRKVEIADGFVRWITNISNEPITFQYTILTGNILELDEELLKEQFDDQAFQNYLGDLASQSGESTQTTQSPSSLDLLDIELPNLITKDEALGLEPSEPAEVTTAEIIEELNQ